MKINKNKLTNILLGILMIGLAFFAGSVKSVPLGMFGFLSFFVIGVTLIIEAFKSSDKR